MNNILDNKRRNQILDSFEKSIEVEKAYTEGIYADTPANRKLGRVGMSYSAYAAKVNGGSIEHGDIRDFKKDSENGQTIYRAELEGKQIKISQLGKKKVKSWIIEKEGKRVTDESGIILKFSSANDAINKTYSILEEEKSEYKFPAPDYLTFKGVRWNNPNKEDDKVGQIHIHRYGKKKPEIVITSKNGNDQTIILLKNSEMKKLLVGLSKKENVSLKLDYSEDDMQFWPTNKQFRSKEITLNYDADKGIINYHREPASYTYATQDYTIPSSALDGVLKQFSKNNNEEIEEKENKVEEIKIEKPVEKPKQSFNVSISGKSGSLSGNKKWSFKIGDSEQPLVIEGDYKDAERKAIKEAINRGIHNITVL